MNKKYFFAFLSLGPLLSASPSFAEMLAGRTYNRVSTATFSFDPPNQDFSGLSFNPLSQTFYMADNQTNKLFEIQSSGALIRTIDVSALKKPTIANTDPEGITWMYGQTYAIVMEDGEEMAIVQITPTTTAITRAQATIYNLSGDPKGVTYKASENALYWISQSGPKRVVKSRINAAGGLDILANINVDALPASDLGDLTYFPRLSPNMLIVSQSSKTVMEVDLASGSPVLRSLFSTAAWNIPKAGGISFGADGKMFIVGKHVSGAPEDDFNVFAPTGTITNRRPTARITAATP